MADAFGPDLPSIRSWTEENFDFAGYVTGFDPGDLGDPRLLRSRPCCREGERLSRRAGESVHGYLPDLHRHLADLRSRG